MKHLILAGIVMTQVAVAQTLDTGAVENERTLSARGAQAQTADEHLAVSNEYRKQASTQQAKVREYAEEVIRLQRQRPDPLAMKWRHARPDPVAVAKERLLEAKRALQEAQDAAQHHAQVALALWMKSNSAASADSPAKQENQATLTR